MSDLVKQDDLGATLDAFTSFAPQSLAEAKTALRSTLMAELKHRQRLMTIRFNETVIKPALARLEAEWAGVEAADIDTTLFEVDGGADHS